MLALLIAAYCVGGIPFSVLVVRLLRGVDLRRSGSGNPGAMNSLRTAGPMAGVVVAALDAAKGGLPVLAGQWLIGAEAGALAGCAAVIGHCFSPYMIATSGGLFGHGWKMALRRAGGKGLATGGGVLLAIAWPAALIAIAIFGLALVVLPTDDTIPAVIAVFAAVPAMWYFTRSPAITVAALVVALVIAVKHLPDMREAFWVEPQE
jgi:glycerol-3-phosphate acyltransferase PlsY